MPEAEEEGAPCFPNLPSSLLRRLLRWAARGASEWHAEPVVEVSIDAEDVGESMVRLWRPAEQGDMLVGNCAVRGED